jgi:hypothetical protein
MKYIPGAKFKNDIKHHKDFPKGVDMVLRNIRRQDGKFIYVFYSNGKLVSEVTFDNTIIADEIIDKFKGV